jgi:hypothetical protein
MAACGDDDDNGAEPSPTPPAATATAPSATSTPTTVPEATDPCTTRTSLEGNALAPGASFELDASHRWQVCVGGAVAGSSEKYLFRSADGGTSWTLISRTTLGNPTPEAGVGDFPNPGAVAVMLFIDASNGWIGLQSPGDNLYHTQDGGVSWTAITALPPAVPVTTIEFTDALNGTVTTSESTWTTTDGGDTWVESP